MLKLHSMKIKKFPITLFMAVTLIAATGFATIDYAFG